MNEEVLGFDITMKDILTMHVGESFTDLTSNGWCFGFWKFFLPVDMAEIAIS